MFDSIILKILFCRSGSIWNATSKKKQKEDQLTKAKEDTLQT